MKSGITVAEVKQHKRKPAVKKKKKIPAWPKVRWSADRDVRTGDLILRGDTLWGKTRLAVDQPIDYIEFNGVGLPFWVVRRQMMGVIRTMLSQYVDRKLV